MTAIKDWVQHEIDSLRRQALILEGIEMILYASPVTSDSIRETRQKIGRERELIAKDIAHAERVRLKPPV